MAAARHAVPGAVAVLAKPADPDELLRAVREALG
jgi:ActR/RegA family two-component response regulator